MRKIHCHRCARYLGTIRDATLRIGTLYACQECVDKEEAWVAKKETDSAVVNDILSMLHKGKRI